MMRIAALIAASAMACAVVPASAATVVLDFDGFSNEQAISQSYGDQVGLLDVSYRSMSGPGNSTPTSPGIFSWDSGYGSLANVAYAGATSGSSTEAGEITFTLTNPGTFTLNSVDFAGWPYTDQLTSFRVYDLSYNLLADIARTAPGSGFESQSFNLSSTEGLRLQWGSDSYYTGIDNLSFSVSAAPEPASWLMMILGFGLVGGALRRRRGQGKLVTAWALR